MLWKHTGLQGAEQGTMRQGEDRVSSIQAVSRDVVESVALLDVRLKK
ncbi:hypothetical protein [Paenibacillus massiliensis]|nr:hypothetical protein [Paenibacillus massiliensis]